MNMYVKIIVGIVFAIIILGALYAVLGRSPQKLTVTPSPSAPSNMETITLKARDGVTIVGDYYPASSRRAVLLLPMMPATKESWRDFAVKLQAAGFRVLAIDLRGHGASEGGPDGYKKFLDSDTQMSINDVDVATIFFSQRGITRDRLSIIGASIGANLALKYMVDHPEMTNAALLSPGLDYSGITAEQLMAQLGYSQRILLVGSNDDPQSNKGVLDALIKAAPAQTQTKEIVYRSAGHGTNMFGKESPDLASELINWLAE